MINSSSQKEKLLMQSKSHQKQLQLRSQCIAVYDKNWNSSNCRTNQMLFNAAKMSQIESVLQKLLYVEVLFTSISMKWKRCFSSSSHSNCTSSHTSKHNSMRHRWIFDIFEFICRSFIELQLRSLLMYFKDWMQRLLSCKSRKIDLIAEFFSR